MDFDTRSLEEWSDEFVRGQQVMFVEKVATGKFGKNDIQINALRVARKLFLQNV